MGCPGRGSTGRRAAGHDRVDEDAAVVATDRHGHEPGVPCDRVELRGHAGTAREEVADLRGAAGHVGQLCAGLARDHVRVVENRAQARWRRRGIRGQDPVDLGGAQRRRARRSEPARWSPERPGRAVHANSAQAAAKASRRARPDGRSDVPSCLPRRTLAENTTVPSRGAPLAHPRGGGRRRGPIAQAKAPPTPLPAGRRHADRRAAGVRASRFCGRPTAGVHRRGRRHRRGRAPPPIGEDRPALARGLPGALTVVRGSQVGGERVLRDGARWRC